MSCNDWDGSRDFDEQLQMQELYGDTKDQDTQQDGGRETDPFEQRPDDTHYEWDLDKKAWFPKITEDFIATYQANYGFSNNGVSSCTANVQDVSARPAAEPLQRNAPEPTDPKKRGEKRKAESGWFHVDEDRNTNVYVSGLPPDTTVGEFIQLMSKFGIIMRDPQTEEFKVKLYKDNQGNLKGDGLCCYLKRESVNLALKLLDKDEIRGYKLHVEVAKFQMKGDYDASKKKKKCKDYKKKLSLQEKQLDWRPERRAGPTQTCHKRVIMKNMFHPIDFENDPLVLNEIREDLRVECSKFGKIRKLLVFDRHPDGVASVSFRDPEGAYYCVQTLHGRWFGGRQITAQVWDGTTDYQLEEATREREERLKGWEAFHNPSETNKGLWPSNSIGASEKAETCRVRNFSEHLSTSKMNAQEAATKMEFEEPTDEKFEKTEDGGEFEGDAKENGPPNQAEEDCFEKEVEEDCLERKPEEVCPKSEHENYLEGESGEDSYKNEFEKDSLEKGFKGNGLRRESKKKQLKNDFEESGLEQESDGDGPQKKSKDDALGRESEEDCSEKSEFQDDSSAEVFSEEGSEREFEEESDRNEAEEDAYEEVFDDASDEKEDDKDTDERKEEDAKEDEKGTDENVFEDNEANEKLFDDSEEKGAVGGLGSVQEERALSAGSSCRFSDVDDDRRGGGDI